MAALRDRKFFSLRELNEAVAEKLDELNSRPFKQMAGCRRSAYLEEEKPYMLPLPVSAFEPAVWSVAKVANDYLVTDGRKKYSVPYNLMGERVDIRVTKTTVEVFYHGSRVASHRRLQTRQRDPLVKREHIQQPCGTQHKALCDGQEELAVCQHSGRSPGQRGDLQPDGNRKGNGARPLQIPSLGAARGPQAL